MDETTFSMQAKKKIFHYTQDNHDFTEILAKSSHDLKNPLASIKAFLQILQKRTNNSLDETSLIYISKIDGQVNNLIWRLNDFIDYAKMNTRAMEFLPEEVDFDSALQDTVFGLHDIVIKTRITIKGKTNARISLDKKWFVKIARNLVEYITRVSSNVHNISFFVKRSPDGVLCTITSDTKIGKDIIFKKNGVNRNKIFSSHGMGVLIAYELLQIHGGHLVIEKKKEAVTFQMLLPAV